MTTTYLNLEKPEENELNWGVKLNGNFDKIDTESNRVNTVLGTKANTNHTHNYSNVYAPISHNHNDLYATLSHTHNFSSLFAPISHNHNDLYSLLNHTHNYGNTYAPLSHHHNDLYATKAHSHTDFSTISDRISQSETRISTLFNNKADNNYVLNLLQNLDHSVAQLTPVINLNGQGSNSQNLKVSCFINSPAVILEWQLSYKFGDKASPATVGVQNTSEFTIIKPSSKTTNWGESKETSITITVKCRNPFLKDDWSKEATLTDNEIEMFNPIDIDKLIASLAVDSHFQNTVAYAIISNPILADTIASQINNQTHSSSK